MKIIAAIVSLFFFSQLAFAQIVIKSKRVQYQPLDLVKLDVTEKGSVKVKDAKGNTYFQHATPAVV